MPGCLNVMNNFKPGDLVRWTKHEFGKNIIYLILTLERGRQGDGDLIYIASLLTDSGRIISPVAFYPEYYRRFDEIIEEEFDD